MVLSENTKKEIILIKDDYERKNKCADENFIKEVMSQIKHEEMFYWYLKYCFTDVPNEDAFMEEKTIFFNVDRLLAKCKNLAEGWLEIGDYQELLPIVNLYVIYSMIHESDHLYQVCGCEHNEVGRFYKNLYDKFQHMSLLQLRKYLKHPLDFCHERHANVDAFREVAEIYYGTPYADIAENSHIYSLNYLKKGTSPVIKTMKDMKMTGKYDFSNLTVYEAINLGLPLEKSTFKEFSKIITLYSKEELSYQSTMKELKKIG